MKRSRAFAIGLGLLASALLSAQSIVSTKGVVVDAKGAPISGARVSAIWVEDGKTSSGPIRLKPYEGATTDAGGRFAFESSVAKDYRFSIMARSRDDKLGCLAVLEPKPHEGLRLTLLPMRTVRAKVDVEGTAGPPEYTNCIVWVGDLTGPIALQAYSYAPVFELAMPPGNYLVRLSAKDAEATRREVRLDSEPGRGDLGTVLLKKSVYGSLLGKPVPPLAYSDSRGVRTGFRIDDTRGKWTILEFWGFW